MNSTIKAIMDRFSCRGFEDKKVSDADLQTILDAAIASPSAWNNQGWHFILCTDKAIIRRFEGSIIDYFKENDADIHKYVMENGGKPFYNTGSMVFVATQPQSEDREQMIDVGIAVQNMCIAAESLGINTLHCGFGKVAFTTPQADELKQLIKFPQGYIIGTTILFGYGTSQARQKQPHEPDRTKYTKITNGQ